MISRDLTEHLLASEALREAHVALVHVTRVTTLGEVTASFAHELNEPRADIVSDATASLGFDSRPAAEEATREIRLQQRSPT